jgi:hypothetical protein
MSKPKHTMPPSQAKSRNVLFAVWLFIMGTWGIFLRSVELINRNFLFGTDHGRDYLAAYNIVVHHKLTLIGAEAGSGVAGINGIFHGPGYFYLIALAYALFDGNPVGAQFFMWIFGVAAMAGAFWVGYRMMGKAGSALFLFFVAVSPLIVSQSRFIWSSHPITVFVILALYCAYRIPDRPRLYAPLSLFIAGFTYHSQLGVSVPLTAGIVLSIPAIYRVRDWRTYLYCIGALLLAFSPMIYFDMRHGYMALHSGISYIQNIGTSHAAVSTGMKVSSHLFDYWNNFYNTFTFEFGWIPWKIQMLILYGSFPFVALGLYMVKDMKLKLFIRTLILMCAFTWVAYFLLNNTVWDYYLTHTRIAYILLFTIAGVTMYRAHRSNKAAFLGLLYFVIFLTTMSVGSVFRMYISYTLDIHDLGVYDKIQGKRLVIDTIYKDAKGKPFSVFVFMPAIYTYPYDYLFETYGKKQYGYEPSHDKKGLAYLLIEPDKDQPWRQKGWLETVVQGGKTEWVHILLNGLILEKRIYDEAPEGGAK